MQRVLHRLYALVRLEITMDESLKCRCGSIDFRLLKNGMIECKHCTKHLNGGRAKWVERTSIEYETKCHQWATFPRKPDLYERMTAQCANGHTVTLELVARCECEK